MKGFVLATGHSGTMWAARALATCADLYARHESMRYEVGLGYRGVEVNGNLWDKAEEIRARFPAASLVHLVRDGRAVVRTLMTKPHKNEWTFQDACRRWADRNARIAADLRWSNRFRLEDLTASWDEFHHFARVLGAKVVDPNVWEEARWTRVNATAHRFPDYAEWGDEERATFWKVCGAGMRAYGYSTTGET